MAAFTCPQCGEDERLAGEASPDGIRIRCEVCQTTWLRDGTIRCATCGGDDIVTRPKTLTAFSRGNQLSVMGWHDVHLCATCDATAVDRSTSSNAPVAWDYLAAAEHRRPTSAEGINVFGRANAYPASGTAELGPSLVDALDLIVGDLQLDDPV